MIGYFLLVLGYAKKRRLLLLDSFNFTFASIAHIQHQIGAI